MAAEVALSGKPIARTTGRPREHQAHRTRVLLATLWWARPAVADQRHTKRRATDDHSPYLFNAAAPTSEPPLCPDDRGLSKKDSQTMSKNNNGGNRSGGSNNNSGGKPSKNPGKPSGGNRDNNPPRKK